LAVALQQLAEAVRCNGVDIIPPCAGDDQFLEEWESLPRPAVAMPSMLKQRDRAVPFLPVGGVAPQLQHCRPPLLAALKGVFVDGGTEDALLARRGDAAVG